MTNYNGTAMNEFTARMVKIASARYKAMCAKKDDNKSIPNLSIHRKAVWGQGYPYHGHVSA